MKVSVDEYLGYIMDCLLRHSNKLLEKDVNDIK